MPSWGEEKGCTIPTPPNAVTSLPLHRSLALCLILASPRFLILSGTGLTACLTPKHTHAKPARWSEHPQHFRQDWEMHRLHRTFLHPSHSRGHPVQTKAISSPATTFHSALHKSWRQRQQITEPGASGDPPGCPTAAGALTQHPQLHHSYITPLRCSTLTEQSCTHPLSLSAGWRASQHDQKYLWIGEVAEGKIKGVLRVIKRAGEKDKSFFLYDLYNWWLFGVCFGAFCCSF